MLNHGFKNFHSDIWLLEADSKIILEKALEWVWKPTTFHEKCLQSLSNLPHKKTHSVGLRTRFKCMVHGKYLPWISNSPHTKTGPRGLASQIQVTMRDLWPESTPEDPSVLIRCPCKTHSNKRQTWKRSFLTTFG